MDIKREIELLKKETDTLILAHTYMDPDIIELADITGDSFMLSRAAQNLKNSRVIVCGVRFMAETVKILSPDKQVILADPGASCPMAEQIDPARVELFRRENPEFCVCAYINTTTALKAQCDVCVTSSTALKIIKALPQKDILFIPDKNLGTYIKKNVPEKNIILWEGFCPVHDKLTANDITEIRKKYPDAKIAVHPECRDEVVSLADYIGATSGIIDYCKRTEAPVAVGTERGVVDTLNKICNSKEFIQIAPDKLVCPDMKNTTPETVLSALKGEGGENIILDDETVRRAGKSIDAMLYYGG